MSALWLPAWALVAAATAAPDDRLPASLMLGKSSTEVSRAFSTCRLYRPSPLVKACEVTIDGHRAAALFLYDSAQLVEQVDVVFPLQAAAGPARSRAQALRALGGGRWARGPEVDRRRQAWEVQLPELTGEVRLRAQAKGWMVSGTFRNPAFKPAYF